jgi:DNA-binding CsgD family transcriptional regulator
LRAGVFFVDGDARLVHSNAAGREMLDAGQPFRSVSGRLTADGDSAATLLAEALSRAEGAPLALGTRGISVAIEGSPRYVAHVLPLTSGARRHAQLDGRAVAAVFVQPQALARPAAPEIIARSYDLTPTELRVLLAVVDVGGVPDVATALGIAETTVRTHLARVYDKTGVNRQADLVKLVAGFASPIAV